MKSLRLCHVAWLLLVLSGCRWDAESIMGGNANDSSPSHDNVPNNPTVSASGKMCHDMVLAEKEKVPIADCAVPEPLEPMIEKLDTTGSDKTRLILTLNPIKEGGDEFPKIKKIVFKAGKPSEQTDFTTLTCRNITPVDDLPKMRLYECARGPSLHSYSFILHSLELENEKCASRIVYETKFKKEGCEPQKYDSWSTYTVWIDKLRVPQL